MTEWISVRNWRKFQHYDPAKRAPIFIKVYTELLDSQEYRRLNGRHRGLLHDIWMLYARARCELPASPSYIAQACGYPSEWEVRARRVAGESVVSDGRGTGETPVEDTVRIRDLKRLEKAGFIDFVASKTLAEGYQPASPEVEVEKEKERDKPFNGSLSTEQEAQASAKLEAMGEFTSAETQLRAVAAQRRSSQ